VGEAGGGMANEMVGTLILIGLACSLGLPVGILGGVYLAEFGNNKFGWTVRFAADVLSGVPSIVIGIFAYTLIVLPMRSFSAYAGGFALGVMMIPVVTRTTEEIVRLVPHALREAALALGVPRWRTTLKVVMRTARGGVITGVMLAICRIAGETAPLLFTAFGNRFWHQGLDQPIASLTVQIFTYAISPFADWQRQAWAGALVLLGMILLTSVAVRFMTRGRFVAVR
jgi:phosphate transport system permease protein